jgi:tetratricopeptide (TPR) repeat protein
VAVPAETAPAPAADAAPPPEPDSDPAVGEALELLRAGRFDKALATADRRLETDPRNGNALHIRAQALSKLGRRADAALSLVKALEVSPDALPFWLTKALMEQGEGRAKEACRSAMDLVEIALHNGAEDPFVEQGRQMIAAFEEKGLFPNTRGYLGWLGLGCVSLATGQTDAALSYFDRAIDAAPSNPESLRWKGRALTQLGQADEALALLDAALELAPKDPAIHHDRGVAFAMLGDVERAVEAFDSALAIDSRHAPSLSERRKYPGGAPEIKDAPPPEAKVAPPPPVETPAPPTRSDETLPPSRAPMLPDVSIPKTAPKYSQDECLKRSEQARKEALFDAALDFADQAIAADSRKYTAWMCKAEALFGLRRYAEAAAHAKKAIELNPKFAPAWVRLASCFDVLLSNREALAAWDKTLELTPQNVLNWNGKGLCLTRMGRLEEALACHEQSLVIDPRFSPGQLHKGLCEADLGRRDDAVKSLQQFLALAPQGLGGLIQQAQQRLDELKA